MGSLRKNKEITTHISIHTLHLDGLRELHRHFLRLDNGAIIEVRIDVICCVYIIIGPQIFGEFGGAEFISSGVKNAIMGRHDGTKTHTSLLDNTPSRPVTALVLGPQRRTKLPKKSLDQISQHSDNLLAPSTPSRTRFDNDAARSNSLKHRKLHKRTSAGQLV